ncbi:MAG: hypothetical protein Q4E54_06080 [Lachnospiraceae bacterium]|nr:hypothetical protein [Lachnospiraceae bacterium]
MWNTTRSEFESEIKRLLTSNGFKRISVNMAWFSLRADVYAKDRRGKRHTFKAWMEKNRGKEYIKIEEEVDELEWIDRIEEFNAFMED